MPDITYIPTTWIDAPSTITPIDAADLNHLEAGIVAATAQANQALAAATDTSQSMSVTPTVSVSGALIPNMHNPVDATSGVLVMTLPAGQPAGTMISVEKINGTVLVPGNKINVVGNMRGVTAATINLSLYQQVQMFLADGAGSWWPLPNRIVVGTLDARYSPLTPAVHVVTSSGAAQTVPAPAVSGGYDHDYTLTAASCAFTLPSGVVDVNGNPAAVELILWLRQNSAGGKGFTITNTIAWSGGVTPTLNQAPNALTAIVVSSIDGGTTWVGNGVVSGSTTTLAAVEYVQASAQPQASTASSTPVDLAGIAATATWAAVGAATFDVTVTAPASGAVLLRASAFVKASGSGASVKLAAYDVGASALVAAGTQTMMTGTSETRVLYEKTITGLTPGASYTYRLQIGAGGGGSAFIDAGGTNGTVRWSAAVA